MNQIPIREVWQKIRAIEGQKNNTNFSVLEDNGIIINNSKNIANTFATTFVNNLSDYNLDPEFFKFKVVSKNNQINSGPR